MQAELAGLMIPTYEQEQTASGALANVWATAGKRHSIPPCDGRQVNNMTRISPQIVRRVFPTA